MCVCVCSYHVDHDDLLLLAGVVLYGEYHRVLGVLEGCIIDSVQHLGQRWKIHRLKIILRFFATMGKFNVHFTDFASFQSSFLIV